jgi:hypothetical protein
MNPAMTEQAIILAELATDASVPKSRTYGFVWILFWIPVDSYGLIIDSDGFL